MGDDSDDERGRVAPLLLFLIGAPAVGKMTVGQELAQLTGLRLFHNHLSIEPAFRFFDFGTPSFDRIVGEFRRGVFEEAAKSTLPGLIFTFVWAFDLPSEAAAVEGYAAPFRAAGGRVLFVELQASLEERLRRNETEFRLAEKPSKRNLAESRRRLLEHDGKYQFRSDPALRPKDWLTLDTTALEPRAVADRVIDHFDLPRLVAPRDDRADFTVRVARVDDYDAVCELLDEVDRLHREQLPWLFRAPDGPARSRELFESWLNEPNWVALVAEADSLLVGVATGQLRSYPDTGLFVPQHCAVLDGLGVTASWRRRDRAHARHRALGARARRAVGRARRVSIQRGSPSLLRAPGLPAPIQQAPKTTLSRTRDHGWPSPGEGGRSDRCAAQICGIARACGPTPVGKGGAWERVGLVAGHV